MALETREFDPLRIFLLAVDFTNAFNQRDRSRIATMLYSKPEYSKLFRFFHFAYSKPSSVVTTQGVTIPCANGVIQGEVSAMEAYAQSVDHVWEAARTAGRAADPRLMSAAIADDGAFVGTLAGIKLVLAELLSLCIAEGIQVNMPKFVLLDPHGADKPTPQDAVQFAAQHGMKLVKGATWHLGAPIGLDQDARAALVRANVGKKRAIAVGIIESEEFPGQCAPLFARDAAGALVHISSVAPPAITRQPLRQFGERLRDACLRKWGIADADTVACEAAVDSRAAFNTLMIMIEDLLDRQERARFSGLEDASRRFFAETALADLRRIGKAAGAQPGAVVWHIAQSVGRPRARWFGLVVWLKSVA